MTELNTYSNAGESWPLTWRDIVIACDEMRKVSPAPPQPVNCPEYWVCRRGEWIREQDDFGFGIFERNEDPENRPYHWQVNESRNSENMVDFLNTYQSQLWYTPEPGG